ncbi:GntR family transcriptional regulator [Georgenia faecalis]|uniref:GntR family transcriptional regulator n=1 Tax=Georgenia faecalis TaxID=2483799 RepID=A0ABV9DC11_9MICO|nr:GntR family transcriptional regulator [Georgenia faecalis]
MKYVTVREYLRGLISDGLEIGTSIPSERELCESFGVSRMTVRQAVDALVVEGLLERIQGRGTFVAQPKVDLQARLTAFDDEMRHRGMAPGSEVLSADRTSAPPEVAAALECGTDEDVYVVRRVRLADGIPMALEESWTPAAILPGPVDAVPPTDLQATLAAQGLTPTWGEDTIDAVTVRGKEAKALGISPGAAGLRICRRTFSGDIAVEYTRSVYRGDRYALWVPVTAPSAALVPPRRVMSVARPDVVTAAVGEAS